MIYTVYTAHMYIYTVYMTLAAPYVDAYYIFIIEDSNYFNHIWHFSVV